jgi:hypothetical protein
MQQKNLEKLAYQECCILNPLQQILPQKVNILFVIKFRRNFRILSFKLYNKIFMIALVNLIIQIESKIQDL